MWPFRGVKPLGGSDNWVGSQTIGVEGGQNIEGGV